MDRQDLVRMKSLTEAKWTAASQSLRQGLHEERAVTDRLAALAHQRDVHARSAASQQAGPEDMRACAVWMRWAESERGRLNMQLARIRARLEAERQKARDAFGKDQAVEKLIEKLEEDKRQARAARLLCEQGS